MEACTTSLFEGETNNTRRMTTQVVLRGFENPNALVRTPAHVEEHRKEVAAVKEWCQEIVQGGIAGNDIEVRDCVRHTDVELSLGDHAIDNLLASHVLPVAKARGWEPGTTTDGALRIRVFKTAQRHWSIGQLLLATLLALSVLPVWTL